MQGFVQKESLESGEVSLAESDTWHAGNFPKRSS